MAKKDVEAVFKGFPALDKAWKDYGFDDNIRPNIVDYKLASLGHYYVAFLVKHTHKKREWYDVIDFAGWDRGDAWAVQNDGSESITPAQFKKMRIPGGCDWLEGWPE